RAEDPMGERITKQERMLTLLSQPAGASIEEMMQATNWQQHSVPDVGKYWFFRFGAHGGKYLALGPLHTISLQRAREKAREARELLIDGRDPAFMRELRAIESTIARCLEFVILTATLRRLGGIQRRCLVDTGRADEIATTAPRRAEPGGPRP